MKEKVNFFTADYRDGKVHIGGKTFPAGHFALHLLNQYYENDTAARIGVYAIKNEPLRNTLVIGYMDKNVFLEAGKNLLTILQSLPWLLPFGMLDTEGERNRIATLFTEETYDTIRFYYSSKAEVYNMTWEQCWLNYVPKSYNGEFMDLAEDLLMQVRSTIAFYDKLSDDMSKAFHALRNFVSNIDEADRFDEEHLLPLALEFFGQTSFSVKTEYVGLKKSPRSKRCTVARRLYFESYLGFILTDFFEGLHFGHYPKRCQVCKQYFLMSSARKQIYCDGLSGYEYNGKELTCRQYAALIGQKELAEAHPVMDIYRRRYSCIRAEQSKGTITKEFATMAKEIAKELKTKVIQGNDYTIRDFERDMTRERLYALTDQRLKEQSQNRR